MEQLQQQTGNEIQIDFEDDDVRIGVDLAGYSTYTKTRSPVNYGRYSFISTKKASLVFNRRSEIIKVRGEWQGKLEWLKRSEGNDWVYYSTGGYSGSYETFVMPSVSKNVSFRIPTPYNEVFKCLGEHYLPNLPYDTNAIIGSDPFQDSTVQDLIDGWPAIVGAVCSKSDSYPETIRRFLVKAAGNTPERLLAKSQELIRINGGRITVLPPDTRHVDYNVIPLPISRGCLYKCRFCRVKDKSPFSPASDEAIANRLHGLRNHYGEDLSNYNSVFLGDHDGLACPDNFILNCADSAITQLLLDQSYMKGSAIFLFGSVHSLLAKEESFFKALNDLNCLTFINIGLESADQETLNYIGKPLTSQQVRQAFHRMQDINLRFPRIECTGNFVMDRKLPSNHYPSLLELVRDNVPERRNKGTIYLSPLCLSRPSSRDMFEFCQLKSSSRLPMYLYLIQRL